MHANIVLQKTNPEVAMVTSPPCPSRQQWLTRTMRYWYRFWKQGWNTRKYRRPAKWLLHPIYSQMPNRRFVKKTFVPKTKRWSPKIWNAWGNDLVKKRLWTMIKELLEDILRTSLQHTYKALNQSYIMSLSRVYGPALWGRLRRNIRRPHSKITWYRCNRV